MKQVFTQFNRILLFLAVSCLSMLVHAQTVVEGGPIEGPCGNLKYKITTTGSPCMKNGKIKVELSGADVEGADPNLSAVQYKAYLNGTDGDKEFFVNENELEGKEAGTYTVEVIGQCKDLLGGKQPLKLSETVVVEQLNGWSYLSMNRETANSFTCTNTGYVKLSSLKGGLPPYSIKFTKKPDEYTGSETIFSGTTLPSNGIIEIKNLPPGDYEITFTEGSSCAQSIIDPFSIGSLALPASGMFFSYAYPGQYGASSLGPDSDYHNVLALSYRGDSYNENYKFFMQNKSEYFEYAIYYGTGTPAMASLSWDPFSFTGSYFHITMPHTVSEMWTVGTSTKRPRIFLRPKGCTEMIEISYSLYTPNPYTSISYADCGVGTFRFYPRYMYYGIFSYPVTWKFTNRADDSLIAESETPIPYASGGTSIYINNLATGSYNLAITDANGYTKNNTITISGNTPVNDVSSSVVQFGCYEEYAPCVHVYNSTNGTTLKSIDSIVYLRTEKYDRQTSVFELDPTFPTPRFPNVKISDISVDSLDKYNSRYFCPWATSLDNTILTSEGILSSTWDSSTGSYKYTTNTQLLKNKLEYPSSPDAYYMHYFRVVDNCGKYREISVSSGSSYYAHVGTPQFVTERPCIDDKAKVMIPNWESVMVSISRQTGTVSPRLYYGYIDKYPSGASILYYAADGTTKGYISSNTDYIIVNKPGTYTFTASPRTWGISEGLEEMYCAQKYEFTIHEIPQFELDDVNTAMYRCPGQTVGQGHIEVAVKNGMGPYKFELQDEERNVLATNDTGIFASGTWSSALNSDYYWIVGYDYGCGRAVTFEKRIKVYNLDNENSAWSYRPNVCVGDSIILNVLALGKTDYNWEFFDENGVLQKTYEGRRVAIPNAEVDFSGKYVSIVTIPGCLGAVKRDTVQVSVGEKLMYWKTDAEDSNWFNKNNWLKEEDGQLEPVRTIPALCTTVHIPGNAGNYPNLSIWENFGYPACDTIVYHYGAETAYPSYLKYSRAKIQYNMGYYSSRAAHGTQPSLNADSYYPGNGSKTPHVMQRSRWYMLSTPLKQMVGGDFGLAGYPKMYQRLFNTTRTEVGKPVQDSFSGTFNNYTIQTVETGNSLALWIPDYDDYLGSKDQKHLDALNGIIEIPYIYDNGTIKENRPLHKFEVSSTDSVSYFYYFDKDLKPVMTQFDTMNRGYQSYRFVFEDNINNKVQEKIGDEYVTIYQMALPGCDTGGRIMIGNPVMSSIDFDKIYALNSSIIENYYQVVTLNGEILDYAIGSPLNDDSKLTHIIPPLQAFIVERKNPQNVENLLFHLDGPTSIMAVAAKNTPHSKPKSGSPAETTENLKAHIIVDCIAKEAVGEGQDFSSRTGVMFNYSDQTNREMSVFEEALNSRADVFFTDNNNYLYRSLVKNGASKPEVLRFGLQSGFFGTIELPITYDGGLIKSIKFVDTYNGTTKENVKSGWVYSFTHRNINENGVQGLDSKRFELHIEYAPENSSGLQEENDADFSINYFNKTLSIESSVAVAYVKLTTLAGVTLFGEVPSERYSYKKEIGMTPGAYIVQVVLENGETKTSKIIEQ